MTPKKTVVLVLIALLAAGAAFSFIEDVPLGKEIVSNTWSFSKDILILLPLTFILIGLFEVWVKREHIERHLGRDAGVRSYLWAVLMGGTVVGPALVALPVALALQKKGASLTVCLIYIGAATVCRIPMTLFEASFLGAEFTAIRYAIALPVVVASSIAMGKFLERRGYRLKEVDKKAE